MPGKIDGLFFLTIKSVWLLTKCSFLCFTCWVETPLRGRCRHQQANISMKAATDKKSRNIRARSPTHPSLLN